MCQSLHNEPSNLPAWGLRRIRLESNNRYSEDVASDIIDWREHVDIQKLRAIRLSFLFDATHSISLVQIRFLIALHEYQLCPLVNDNY